MQDVVQRKGFVLIQQDREKVEQTVQEWQDRADGLFNPNRLVHHGRIQTMMALYRPRGLHRVAEYASPLIVDAGKDETGLDGAVRMIGFYTPHQTVGPSRGLVVSLHGWEGCSHAIFNLVLTARMVREGYDVFRLNLRDHGCGMHVVPHALNRGLFLATLLDESHRGVQRAAELAGDAPVYLIGPSMGGNFVLRMAIAHRRQPIPNLRRVIAINPSINPARAIERTDADWMYHRYYRSRWLRSLRLKQELYPDLYDFSPLFGIRSLCKMTEWLARHYTEFSSADDYFAAYSVGGDDLVGVTVPTTIITAADDPVIPVADFYAIAPDPNLELQIHETGGHCGYVDIDPLGHCLPDLILAAIDHE